MEPAPTPSTALLRTRRGLIFTALPAIAVLAVIGGLLAYNHYRTQVENRRQQASQLAVAAANNARRFVDDSFANLKTAAASPTIRSGSVPAIEDYLPAVADAGDFSSGVSYVGRDGQVRASSTHSRRPHPNLGDRAYFQEALRTNDPTVSNLLISKLTKRPVVTFAFPVPSEDGTPPAVLIGGVRLDAAGQAVSRLRYANNSDETIVDGTGKVIVSETVTDRQMPQKYYDLAAMRARGQGVMDDVQSPDGRRLLGFSSVQGTDWLVIVDRRYADFIGELDAALYAEIVALALLAIGGVLFVLSAGRRIDRLNEERDAALEEQRTIAERLQRSLLPGVPARSAAVDVHATYAPAQGQMAVGGDWYDVVDLPDGRIALSVGDVAGHGLTAASAMGQLRSATRTLALGSHEPDEALAALDRFAMTLDGRPLATVVYAVLDPDTGQLRYSCAGHPPPLLVRANGRTEYLEGGRSPLLGVEAVQSRPVGEATLEPGDTLVCYTDGLIERPDRTIDDGLTDLAQQAAAVARDPSVLAEALLAGVEEPRRDDAAVLCLRLQPVSRPAGGEPQPSSVAS
jgi:serine phosphatase RsbU (regulator of sigma subunit)